jgi:hypothetical protein
MRRAAASKAFFLPFVLLHTLAVTQANGAATWAKWRSATVNTAQVHSNLLINVPLVPGYVAPPGVYGDPLDSGTSVTITVANSDENWIGNGVGFSDMGYLIGSISPNPGKVNGTTIGYIGYDSGTSEFLVGFEGLVAQNFFTQVSFTDRASNVETYATASATYAQASGSRTEWSWLSQYAGNGDPFTAGNEYVITFS